MTEEAPKLGRPSDYTPELAALICERLASGESLRSVCRDDAMPACSTVFLWMQKHKAFSEQYARATSARADLFAEEIIEISDDGSNDTSTDDDGHTVVNHDVIARSRLRVDTRKWLMARMMPKKYGDRVTQEHVGDPENPVQITRIERVVVSGGAKVAEGGEGEPVSDC